MKPQSAHHLELNGGKYVANTNSRCGGVGSGACHLGFLRPMERDGSVAMKGMIGLQEWHTQVCGPQKGIIYELLLSSTT